jgi:hypothetical protein
MSLFYFTVHLHGHAPGDVVEVADADRRGIDELVWAGYLLPIYPEVEELPVPSRHRVKPDESG